jgi:hypothetical protein
LNCAALDEGRPFERPLHERGDVTPDDLGEGPVPVCTGGPVPRALADQRLHHVSYVRDVEVRRQRADLLGPLECLAEYFRGAL